MSPWEPSMTRNDLTIHLDMDRAHLDDLESATIRVRQELLELHAGDVDRLQSADAKAENTKSGTGLGVVGTLLITAPSSAVLTAIVQILKSWVGRSNSRTAKVEIDGDVLEVNGISNSQRDLLIQQWLDRHGDA